MRKLKYQPSMFHGHLNKPCRDPRQRLLAQYSKVVRCKAHSTYTAIELVGFKRFNFRSTVLLIHHKVYRVQAQKYMYAWREFYPASCLYKDIME